MKRIEAVIFDWAGTTVDYGCMAPIHAMKEAFSAHAIDVSLEDIRKPMGMLKIDHIKAVLAMDNVREGFNQRYSRFHDQHDIQKIYQHFEDTIFSTLHQHTALIDGVLKTQAYLRHMGIKIGSTTGYTKKMIDIVSKSAAVQGYQPDYIMSSDQVKRGRPYPYMLHQNIAALDARDIRSVVKVGDTIVDIQEGLYAGCWSIGVIKGSSLLGLNEAEVSSIEAHDLKQRMKNVKDDMLSAGAHHVIDTLDELPAVLDLIQQKMNRTVIGA